jgi:recombination protein RecT
MNESAQTKIHPIIVLQNQLAERGAEFKTVLPAHISPERFLAVVKTAVIDNADLLAADRQSLFRACRRCAQDGLMPDGHEAALVLFKNRVQYIPMYQGLLKLFRNSGQFRHVNTGIVYEGEEYSHWLDETGEHYRHVPGDDRDPKAVRRVYATATTKDGGFFMVDMSLTEVNKHRAVSRASREDAPWKQWEAAMQRKTALRELSKLLPKSSDLDAIMNQDERELYGEPIRWRGDTPTDSKAALDVFGTACPEEAKTESDEPNLAGNRLGNSSTKEG